MNNKLNVSIFLFNEVEVLDSTDPLTDFIKKGKSKL